MSEIQGSSEENLSRRRWYVGAVYGLQAIIGAALAIPAAVYLLFPPKSRKEEQWVETTDLSKLTAGTPEEVVFRRNRVDGWKVSSEKTSAWIVKKSDTEVIAFSPQCTHLGCAFRWEARTKTFLCPCHTSNFSLDGKVVDGPAPRPLDKYLVKIEGTKVLLGPVQTSPEA